MPSDTGKRISATELRKARQARLVEMFEAGWTMKAIENELDITPSTRRNWMKSLGLPLQDGGRPAEVSDRKVPAGTRAKVAKNRVREVPSAKSIAENMMEESGMAGSVAKGQYFDAQDNHIEALANGHETPAEAYQAFAASKGMKLLKDGFDNIRPPKTVKELDILDKVIRRNLGLDSRAGGGAGGHGHLRVDINVLNSPTRRNLAETRTRTKVTVTAEPGSAEVIDDPRVIDVSPEEQEEQAEAERLETGNGDAELFDLEDIVPAAELNAAAQATTQTNANLRTPSD